MSNHDNSEQKSQISLTSKLQQYLKITIAIFLPLFILFVFTQSGTIAEVIGNEGIAIAGGAIIGLALTFVMYAPFAIIVGFTSWFVIHQIINHQIHF